MLCSGHQALTRGQCGLGLFHGFQVLFYAVEVLSEFICFSPKFIEHPYNKCVEICISSLSPFSLFLLLSFVLFFYLGHVSLSLHFGTLPYVCFCVLGRAAMPPFLGTVA